MNSPGTTTHKANHKRATKPSHTPTTPPTKQTKPNKPKPQQTITTDILSTHSKQSSCLIDPPDTAKQPLQPPHHMRHRSGNSSETATMLPNNDEAGAEATTPGNQPSDVPACTNSNNHLEGWSTPAKVLVSTGMGMTFGVMFARSRVFEPMVIRGQFTLTNFAMMKMFLAAVTSSSLVFSAVQFTSLRDRFDTMRKKRGDSERHLGGLFLGGLISGVGMAVGGACPGMVLPQLGAGVPNAIFTYVGGLVGAILYGLTDQFVKPLMEYKKPTINPETADSGGQRKRPAVRRTRSTHLDEAMGWSARKTMLVLAAATASVVALLEVFFPWTSELPRANLDGCTMLTCHAIPPSLAGFVLGALQLPGIFFLGSFLGTSSSYCAMTSSWTNFTQWGKDSLSYMHKLGEFTFSKWWQVFYVAAAVLGAYLAEMSAGGLVQITGLPIAHSFCGGMLMLYGARMAGGCTSGHGLTGTPALVIDSMLALVGMFVGGFATAGVWSLVAPGTYMF
jgi:uncharacterized membrane protein YedE/YeeE